MPTLLQTTLVVVLASSVAFGGVLKGKVRDKAEGAPIDRAYILVHPSGGGADVKTTSDENGLFEVQLPPGFYDVFVARTGFAPTAVKVEISEKKPAIYNPQLAISLLESREIDP